MNKIYCFGELLWDILPDRKSPGGAPMNVAYHLNKLDLPAYPITAVGNDDYGRELLEFLESKEINTGFITTNAQPTGLVTVALNEKNEASYIIHAPAAWDFIELSNESLDAIYSQEYILIFGSLACRNSINRDSIQKLASKASLKICDINLRAPYFNKDLVHYLFSFTDWIKINDEELELITSWYRDDLDTEGARAQFILNTFPEVDLILITRGAKGAAYYDRVEQFNHPGFQVKVADTIGSGDSFLAMFIYKALNGDNPDICLKYACAMGSTVATFDGATPDFDPLARVEILLG